MSLSEILNLSKPGLVAIGFGVSLAVVGVAVQALRYKPNVIDSCEGVPAMALVTEDGQFERVTEQYLQRTRKWSQWDYCIDKKWVKDNERIFSVLRKGKLVGGGEGFQVRIDPATMTVLGELPHDGR